MMKHVLVLLLTFALAAPVAALNPGEIHFLSEDGTLQRGQRCATQSLTAEQRAQVQAEVGEWMLYNQIDTEMMTVIPVAFHVVYQTRRGVTTGNVPQSQIDAQIDVLNAAFAGTGFSFVLSSVDRTNSRKWFTRCGNSRQELQMKSALAISVPTTLNIYTCEPSGGILGYAYLPPTLPENDVRHGVVLLHSSLPGGTAAPYNEGDTGTHEVGHYLGLDHTFEGGCGSPGDSVADTAPEASPAFGCPAGRDTCAGGGPDPIFNFMDYTDDFCMDEFTSGQSSRMQTQVSIYKPSL